MEYYRISKINKIQISHPYENLNNLDKNVKLDKYTDVWCWNCCHKFNNYPYFCPTKFDSIKKEYQVKGIFCSWECAKRYLFEQDSVGIKSALFTKMVRDLEGSYKKIYPAPPRQILEVFGGNLTIEQFRNYNKNSECIREIRELKFPMIPIKLVFEEICRESGKQEDIQQIDTSSTKLNNITSNVIENWKLKRSKPLKNTKGTLESTMGVMVKK